MTRIIFPIGLISLICTSFLVNSAFAGFICPPSQEIKPCKCGIYRESATEENGYTICHGQEVTQESITRVFSALRRVNELSPVDWLILSYFRLAETKLTTLDLTPLFHSRAKLVTLYNNTELFEITTTPFKNKVENSFSTSLENGAANENKTVGLIQTEDLVIGQSPINTTTFESGWLRSFSIEHLKKFTVGNTHLTQVPEDLSSFTLLETVEFWNSRIQRVGGGQFKGMGNLSELRFTANELEYIGENAFEFHEDSGASEDLENSNSQIKISLESNKKLSESSFHRNWVGSLISKMEEHHYGNRTLPPALVKRPIYLDLSWTNLTTLPAELFQGFLDFHHQNELKLFGAPLKCDGRVAWLQNKMSEYEKRVHVFQTCKDGGSVFTSELKE